MKNKKWKIIVAWVILLLSISFAFLLTYLKFFSEQHVNIEEKPINESSSNAIHKALKDIAINFNQNPKTKKYAEDNNVTLIASVNNYSIFISYIIESTTTYEFSYDNLCLNITISNTDDNKVKFNTIYEILIESVQKRLNNTNDINNTINDFLNNNKNYDGLTKNKEENNIKYQINITKKI